MKVLVLWVSMELNVIISVIARTTHLVIHKLVSVSVNVDGLEEHAIKSVQTVIMVKVAKKDVLITCHTKQPVIM